MSYPQRPLSAALTLADCAEAVVPDKEYRITGVYSFGKGLISRPTISGRETAYATLHRLSSGQIVMSKLNAWEGAIALVGEEYSGRYVSPEYPTYDINSAEACPRYLAHLMAWPRLWEVLTPQGSMVRRKRTTPSTFLASEVPLPDRHEQQRVAAKLDAATAKLDQVSRLRIIQSEKAAALRDAMLSQPSERVPLSDLLVPASDLVRVEPAEQYQAIGIYSYGRGVFKRTPVAGSETSYSTLNRVHAGQFIFSKLFAWEGALATVTDEFEGCFASSEFPTFSVRRDHVDMRYLAHVTRWPRFHNGLKNETTGMGSRRQRVNVKNMLKTEIPLPSSLTEQRRIASMLDAAETIPDPRSLAKSNYLKDIRVSLLSAAFTGKL